MKATWPDRRVLMSSVLRALYDHSLSLPQRLKVARYLWGQEDILSEEKTAFLVKWVCGELCTVYNRKNQRPPSSSISCELWKFLSFVLTAIVEEEDAKELSALNIHLFQVYLSFFADSAIRVGGADLCREWAWFSYQQPKRWKKVQN